VVAVRDDFIGAHESVLYEFTDMLVRAGQFMEQHPEKAAEIGVEFLDPDHKLGLTVPLLRTVLAEGVRTGNLFPDKADFQKIGDYMFSEMKIGKKIDADLFLDTRFAKAACGKIREMFPAPLPESALEQPRPNQKNDEKTVYGKKRIKEKHQTETVPGLNEEDHERSDTIRISVDILDQLMSLTGELVLIRNRELLSTAMSDPGERSISQRLSIVTAQLQETVLQTRMQPIGNVLGKLPRIVRELGKKYGKETEISLGGRDTEVDRSILDSLVRPLVCALIVCCRDSIESPEERKKAGKSPAGKIRIEADSSAGEIHIRIRDDGRGIDPDAVKKAIAGKGIRNPGQMAGMSEKEILSLLFLPEISAAQQMQIPGACPELHSIHKTMLSFNGMAEIESAAGEGTVIHLRLPMTLAIIPSLIVAQGQQRYAIAQMNVEELVCLYDEDVNRKIEKAGNQRVYRLRDRILPLVHLGDVLAHSQGLAEDLQEVLNAEKSSESAPPDLSEKNGQSLTFAVVRTGNRRFGLIIDRVLGTEDIVVKAMHPLLSGLRMYSGVTVMGDGRVVLILDMEGICSQAGIHFRRPEETDSTASGRTEELQKVLLFKNGISEQFALALPLIRRVERIAAADIEKVGNREFVTVYGVSTRIIRLDSILHVSPCEMKEEMFLVLPKFISRPFGILVSQILDISSVSGDLNTESHREDGLPGTAVVRGHMTLFIDIFRVIELAEPDWFAERKKDAPLPEEKKHILLVEDSHFFRRLVKGYLESDLYTVTMAEHGEEALGCMEKGNFDLIISDLNMPVMDGWTFLKKVRKEKRYRNIPAIALTALDSETDQARAQEAGFNGYEIKLNRERLLFNVAKLLRQPAQQKKD